MSLYAIKRAIRSYGASNAGNKLTFERERIEQNDRKGGTADRTFGVVPKHLRAEKVYPHTKVYAHTHI